jgi:hypothetical protein
MKRLFAVGAVALASSSAALAHGPIGGVQGYVSTISALEPNVLGVNVAVIGGDDRLRLANYSGKTIDVLGYDGEPFLRFSSAGVYENLRSGEGDGSEVGRSEGGAALAQDRSRNGQLRLARPPHPLDTHAAAEGCARRAGPDPSHLQLAGARARRRQALRHQRLPGLRAGCTRRGGWRHERVARSRRDRRLAPRRSSPVGGSPPLEAAGSRFLAGTI